MRHLVPGYHLSCLIRNVLLDFSFRKNSGDSVSPNVGQHILSLFPMFRLYVENLVKYSLDLTEKRDLILAFFTGPISHQKSQ